jgi:hypothetical protein
MIRGWLLRYWLNGVSVSYFLYGIRKFLFLLEAFRLFLLKWQTLSFLVLIVCFVEPLLKVLGWSDVFVKRLVGV